MLVSALRSEIILTLNETDPPTHFEDPVILNAIGMAMSTIGALTKFGVQKDITATTDGTAKLPISDSIVSVVRVNKVGDCGVTEINAETADKLNSGWRGCSYQGDEASKYVLEDDEVWLVPVPEAGVTVSLTVAVADADPTSDIPVNILPGVRHFALQYCYERLYGANHASAAYHNQSAYKYLLAREHNFGQL